MSLVSQNRSAVTQGGGDGLDDVLELVLDRGLMVDAFTRLPVPEVPEGDTRAVTAGADAHLRLAAACDRLGGDSGGPECGADQGED
ncbi:hypothetical protein [Streptomyces sp. NPDC003688]